MMSRRRSREIYCVLFGWIAAPMILWGCASRAIPPALPAPTPREVILRLTEEAPEVKSLQAWGRAKWRHGGQTRSAQNAILLKRPDMLRMEGLSPFGSSVYSLVIRQTELTLLIPSEKRVYRGEASPEILERFLALPMTAEDALSVLSGSVPLCRGRDASVHREGELIVLNLTCEDAAQRQEVRLNSSHLDPVEFLIRDLAGREILKVAWGGFQSFGDARVPSEIQAEMPLRGSLLDLRLDQIAVNQPTAESRFHLLIPPGAEIRPLY